MYGTFYSGIPSNSEAKIVQNDLNTSKSSSTLSWIQSKNLKWNQTDHAQVLNDVWLFATS